MFVSGWASLRNDDSMMDSTDGIITVTRWIMKIGVATPDDPDRVHPSESIHPIRSRVSVDSEEIGPIAMRGRRGEGRGMIADQHGGWVGE